MPKLDTIMGPRVAEQVRIANRARFIAPTVFLVLATVLLVASFGQPYWSMSLLSPAHPDALRVDVYLNHLEGDVAQVNEVNRDIGMPALDEAARLERHLSWLVIVVFGLLVVAAVAIHSPWAAVASLPALLFPVGFLVDMSLWLARFGKNIDPATVPEGVEPFTPSLWGEQTVGQYTTVSALGTGFLLAVIASVFILMGLWFHRRAYKPVLDAKKRKAVYGWTDEKVGASKPS